MAPASNSYDAYKRVNIETASQSKLVVMLFNGAIQRAEEGKRALEKDDVATAHNNLLRAQEIVAELRGALDMSAGEIAENLDKSYEYFHHLLVTANIRKETQPIEECVGLMTTLRDTWEEVFRKTSQEEPVPQAPQANPHGASIMNIQG